MGESTSSFVFILKREHIDIRRVRSIHSAWISKLSSITDWDEAAVNIYHVIKEITRFNTDLYTT